MRRFIFALSFRTLKKKLKKKTWYTVKIAWCNNKTALLICLLLDVIFVLDSFSPPFAENNLELSF